MLFARERLLHIQSMKEPAASREIEYLQPASIAIVPLCYKGKAPLRCDLRQGKKVPEFTYIAHPHKNVDDSCAMLMPVTGRLIEIKEQHHPLLGRVPCAYIETDKKAGPIIKAKTDVPRELDSEKLLQKAKMSCIVDTLDGVLLYKKLLKIKNKNIDVLVVDCIEDEPYSSALHRVLIERGGDVAKGARYAMRATLAKSAAIVCNIPARRFKLQKEIDSIPVKCISGGYPLRDKLKKLFKNQHYETIGAEALAEFYLYLCTGQGQTSCVVTVAGDCVKNPANVQVKIGTPIYHVLRYCGLDDNPKIIVAGDIMRGVRINDTTVPIIPLIRTILALSEQKSFKSACIGCGRCINVCHKGLMPYSIYKSIENGDEKSAKDLGINLCDFCGACSYICPSKLNISQYIYDYLMDNVKRAGGRV